MSEMSLEADIELSGMNIAEEHPARGF